MSIDVQEPHSLSWAAATRSAPDVLNVRSSAILGVAGALTVMGWTTASSGSLPESARIETTRCILGQRTSGGPTSITSERIPEERRDLAAVLAELRRRSGLTWDQLAQLFGVDRRSIHFWASGRPLSASHAERLGKVAAVIHRVDLGDPSVTRAWLLTPTESGTIPFELLRSGRFDEIPSSPKNAAAPQHRPPTLPEAEALSRAPASPEALVDALQDRVHVERTKLIKSVPLNVKRTK